MHAPQLIVPPQPLGAVPQFCPAGHVVAAVHPQTLGVPLPPQVCGNTHAGPHATVPPHPSATVPQLSPAGHVVAGMHVVTVICAVTAWTADGAVPITVKVTGPPSVATALALSVSVDELPAVTLAGRNAPVTPVGRSWTLRTMASAAPSVDAVVTTYVTVPLRRTLREAGAMLSEKSFAAQFGNFIDAICVSHVEAPVV